MANGMQPSHRIKITQNIDKLIRTTSYNDLMKECIDRKLIFDVMRSEIEKSHPIEHERHKKLLEKITHRGPKAYEIFLSILSVKFPDAFFFLRSMDDENDEEENFISIRENNVRPRDPPIVPMPVTNRPIDINENRGTVPIKNNIQPTASSSSIEQYSNSVNNNIDLVEYTGEVHPTSKYTVIKSKQFHVGKKVSAYKMDSRNRGVLFLVNNIHFKNKAHPIRNGAKVDRDNFIHVFRQMGFKILYYEDLTKQEFIRLVDKLVISQYLHETDCLVFSIMSHGDRDYSSFNVEFVDSQIMDVEDILMKFSNKNCTYMINQPKIFVFPFCRGKQEDGGVTYRRKTERDNVQPVQTDGIGTKPIVSTFSDMKICYASVPGYVTFRDPTEGSWYIQVMCEVFAQHAHDTEFDELLKIIGNTMSQKQTEDDKKQTCSNEDRGYSKELYFNPGYYGEND